MNKTEAIEILANDLPRYTTDFDKLYELYCNYDGNKERAFKIYKDKWSTKNIEALEVVIKMYLEDLEKIKTLDFKPHFESFLHSRLESYILKKQKEI